jgi:hypothetical protein
MKIITTTLLILSVTLLKAQTNPATPNANFEDWTHVSSDGGYDDPNGWNCLNPTTAVLGTITCVKDSTNVRSGKYAVHLITEEVASIETAPGALTTGTINTTSQTISGGLPYTLRPDSIIGWYMYTSVSGDNGDCEFYLFGSSNSDTIGQAFYSTPKANVAVWTRFSLAITYTSTATPVTALWIFSSSINQAGGQVGSQLYIDSIGLVINPPTGIAAINNSDKIAVGPNPTTGNISITNNSTSKSILVTIYDITGRKVEEGNMTEGVNYMNLAGMPDGLYIYTIQDEQSAVIKTGKIVVQK